MLGGQPIGDPVEQVGFADLSCFYAQFRRITGNTPTEHQAVISQKCQDAAARSALQN